MPSALDDVKAVLRNQGFEELIENADTGASYMRSLGEAAYRGDAVTVGVHLKQLRALVVAMIKTYKEDVDGQDGAIGRQPALDNRQDQRPGNGDPRG